ncbi:hypothetical protein LTR78_000850 [Recurvomyces mirabilis]|uniref:RNA helicase HEL117 n=1 Tax=Recurvomyces mirabilis TaxID=574656 RepID=A0AAE0WWF4_9PEZI|nr:hypothetical protein LTR78_000850 [Recurvomyces mirabilis]KAK5158819.1 hypothetical protein LTS14_002927 [Recurvomyces mirabilis]
MYSNRNNHRPDQDRKRSRSPYHGIDRDVKRTRPRSPYRKSGDDHHASKKSNAIHLPFHAHHLHKRGVEAYRPLLANYLDVQKNLNIDDLDEDEVKGRWKSFLGKWNRGELAEGWYDPATKQKADERYEVQAVVPARDRDPPPARRAVQEAPVSDDEEDDGYGPALPEPTQQRAGPAIPRAEDFEMRREQAEEDREARLADARYDRKQDRKLQQERLDEMAPRADPGSRERQLEKKRVATATNRDFREAKDGGEVEVAENDLMGDDGDGYKKQRKELEKKKSEREIRKEEVLRARAAEREERLEQARRKEDKTMDMLRDMAKQRFG